MRFDRLFDPAQRQAVADAIGRAEGRTSGEIVPVVVGACDDYDETRWKAAALGALAVALAAGVVHWLGGWWGGWGVAWISLPAALGAAAGFTIASFLPAVRRALVPADTLELRVRRRALAAFVEEEVFQTRDRTGILIFVGLFERRVVVLGDAGINRAVPEGTWQGVVDGLVRSIRTGHLAGGLVAAVERCGELLAAHRVDIRPDDVNELADDLRLSDR